MSEAQRPNRFEFRDIMVTAEASSIEKWRKQVIAGQPETGRFYAFIADEGSYMPGGEGTAPTPLTYFVSGMALCLISHISQVAKKRKLTIKDERVKVTAHFHEQGSVLRGDAEGFCDAFEIEIMIESDEAPEAIAELVRLSHAMCFTEKALSGSTPISAIATLNGKPIQTA